MMLKQHVGDGKNHLHVHITKAVIDDAMNVVCGSGRMKHGLTLRRAAQASR
jgi:hypothetical protein